MSQAVITTDQIIAATTVVVGFTLAFVVARLLRAIGRRLPDYASITRIASRVLATVIVGITIITGLSQLGVDVAPLLGAVGITGVVVALSLQPVLGNLVGALLIRARRPIRPGDQINSNEIAGTVLDINGRAVILLTHDGTTTYIPNLKLLDEPLENLTREPLRRTRLVIEVDYATDLRTAQRVLQSAASAVDGIEVPVVALVRSFEDSGVRMEVRFWHPSEELEAAWIVSEVAIAVREALRDAGIEIAFPQRVVHFSDPDREDGG